MYIPKAIKCKDFKVLNPQQPLLLQLHNFFAVAKLWLRFI